MTRTIRALSLAASLGLAVVPAVATGVPGSAAEVRPLLIGSEVPDVTLKTLDGADFELRAAVARKPTVLIFYRGGW